MPPNNYWLLWWILTAAVVAIAVVEVLTYVNK